MTFLWVTRPGLTSMSLPTYALYVCSSFRREHIRAKETTAASVYSPACTYLRSRGRSGANNASYVHATVPPHPLSSNVSFFLYVYRTWLTWGMEKTEGTREGGQSARAIQLLQKCGVREEGTSRRTFASAASFDNTRRKREGEKYLRNSHINNYCYSVMTDVGHGKTR